MLSAKEFVLFFVVSSFVSVQCEVILPPTVEEPKCDYDGLGINLMNAELRTIRGDIFSSSSVNPFINCINLSNNRINDLNVTAFRKLPNLYYLDLSENWLPSQNFVYDFSTIKILVLNRCLESSQDSDCRYRGYCREIPRLRIFSRLTNLKKLYLRSNTLKSLSWKRGTPNITHLYLDDNRIDPEFLSLYIPPTLTHLSLSNNEINQFDRSPILKQLEELNLSNNKIQILCFDDNCHDPPLQEDSDEVNMRRTTASPISSQFMDLKGATKLKKLSISFNKIQEIRQDTFIDSTSLQYLNLTGNLLGKNPTPNAFEHLINLNILILDHNNYTTIPSIFGLPHLETLMLKGNEIEAITLTSFDDSFLGLKILSLANNSINRIESGSFNNLQALEELDLSGNQLVTLPDNWITLQLQRLHLDRNRFTNIESMALKNMTGIQHLNIAGNPFQDLSMQTLRSLPENIVVNVRDIELVNNKPSNCSGMTVDN